MPELSRAALKKGVRNAGRGAHENRNRFFNSGCCGGLGSCTFVLKPIDPHELKKRVTRSSRAASLSNAVAGVAGRSALNEVLAPRLAAMGSEMFHDHLREILKHLARGKAKDAS